MQVACMHLSFTLIIKPVSLLPPNCLFLSWLKHKSHWSPTVQHICRSILKPCKLAGMYAVAMPEEWDPEPMLSCKLFPEAKALPNPSLEDTFSVAMAISLAAANWDLVPVIPTHSSAMERTKHGWWQVPPWHLQSQLIPNSDVQRHFGTFTKTDSCDTPSVCPTAEAGRDQKRTVESHPTILAGKHASTHTHTHTRNSTVPTNQLHSSPRNEWPYKAHSLSRTASSPSRVRMCVFSSLE